jgi:uncharacterized protein
MRALPSGLLAALEGVDAILHAGDVCTRRVLNQLGEVAPVHAVRGNRDWLLRLPADRVLDFDGARIAMTHGHGGLFGYLHEKLLYFTVGYYFSRYVRQVRERFAGTGVQAIVFGHSHLPVNQLVDGVLVFNPGSIAPVYRAAFGPSFGLLTIEAGQVRGEIVALREIERAAA